MPSPFPGMDPYPEQPAYWSAFHSRLIVALADAIEPTLNPDYYIEVETRTYLSDADDESLLIGIPDAVVLSSNPQVSEPAQPNSATALQTRPQQVEIPMPEEVTERYLEIRETANDTVITTLEVLSPKNKQAGKGRTTYLDKRNAILGSATHLIEIDLLRAGRSLPIQGQTTPTPYRILLSRSQYRPRADLYGIVLNQPLPSIPIPLKPNETEPIVHLQTVFDGIYDRARYANRIDYTQPLPAPQLSAANRQWVQLQLQDQ